MAHNLDFQIITSLRSDGMLLVGGRENEEAAVFLSKIGSDRGPCQFYMLRYHKDRMQAALQAFNRPYSFLDGANGLIYLEEQLHNHLKATYGDPHYPSPLKVRSAI